MDSIIGWNDLGVPAEAEAELNQLLHEEPLDLDVLNFAWAFYSSKPDWVKAHQMGERIIRSHPGVPDGWLHSAYALRRMPGGGLEKAWELLSPAMVLFPKDALVHYNLACYSCQMNSLPDARLLLDKAIALGGPEKILKMALKDPDLRPLWPQLRKL